VLQNIERARRLKSRGAGLVAAFWLASLWSAAHAQRDDPPLPPRLDAPLPANTQSVVSPRAGADEPRAATPPAPAGGAAVSGAGATEGPGRPPKAARLAPLPESRGEAPDEIVVLGSDDPWRLAGRGGAGRAALACSGHVLAFVRPRRPPRTGQSVFDRPRGATLRATANLSLARRPPVERLTAGQRRNVAAPRGARAASMRTTYTSSARTSESADMLGDLARGGRELRVGGFPEGLCSSVPTLECP
jgi:hypothetical protein